eukprot:scaffold5955_cov103-Isochrysis_galbana.AAC.3
MAPHFPLAGFGCSRISPEGGQHTRNLPAIFRKVGHRSAAIRGKWKWHGCEENCRSVTHFEGLARALPTDIP